MATKQPILDWKDYPLSALIASYGAAAVELQKREQEIRDALAAPLMIATEVDEIIIADEAAQ